MNSDGRARAALKRCEVMRCDGHGDGASLEMVAIDMVSCCFGDGCAVLDLDWARFELEIDGGILGKAGFEVVIARVGDCLVSFCRLK